MFRYLKILLSSNNDLETEKGRSDERIRRLMLGSIMSMLHKALTMLTPLITIRITFSYLGQEVYGLWTAITTFFTMFTFADLGLGNGLQTELSRASGQENFDKKAQKIISSAFAMLILVAVVILLIFLGIYPYLDWAKLVNATSESTKNLASLVVLAIFIPRVINIPLSLVQRIQLALQDSYNSYLWQIIGSILSLISIVLIAHFNLGSLFLIFISTFIPVLVLFINLLFYFLFIRKDLRPSIKKIDKKIVTRLLSTGIYFLVLSVLTTIGLSLDNFIVAKVISLDESAIYSILFKIVHMISTLSTMVTSLLWGANGEAMGRGDFIWVKNTTNRVSVLALIISTIASFLILVFINPIISLLVGIKTSVSLVLVIGMCIFEIIISVTSPFFMILNASNNVRIQILLFSLYTPVSFVLKYYLANLHGSTVIPWVGVFSYTLIISPWIITKAKKIINKGIINGRLN